MFSRADLVDIYSLADPNRCAKYIVVAADALETLFVKIRLDPAATKEGTLYFQSVDGLTKGTSLAALGAQDKKKIYCKQVAFFFIRIFQVFAALTLTMLDSELPAVDPSDTLPEETRGQRRPTFIDPRTFLGVTQAAKQRGGRFTYTSGTNPIQDSFYIQTAPYNILNDYLQYPRDLTSQAPLQFERDGSLRVSQTSLYQFIPGIIRIESPTIQPVVLYSIDRNGPKEIVANMTFKEEGSEKLRVTISNIQERGGKKSMNTIEGTFRYDRNYSEWIYEDKKFPEAYNRSLPTFLKAVFNFVADELFGKLPIDLFKLFQSWGLLEPTERTSSEGIYRIAGTKLFVSERSAGGEQVNFTYRDDIKFAGESKSTRVVIKNIIFRFPTSGDKITTTLDGQKTFYLKLDFKQAVVDTTPSGFESEISSLFPTESNTKQFVLSRSSYSQQPQTTDVRPRPLATYLQEKLQAIIQNRDEDLPDGTGIQYTRQGLPVPHNSDSIPPDFRIKAIWKALAKDPPIKSHCVARATQLLSVAAIRGKIDDSAYTQACRTTFLYQKDGSLPVPGQSIFKPAREATGDTKFQGEYGILALAQLFVEGLDANGNPKLLDKKRYQTFLANLKFAFEKTKAVDLANPPATLGEIRERMPGGVCERDPNKDKPLLVPQGLASNLQGVTRQLMKQQVEHVGQALNLMFELFDKDAITRKRQFALNPKILAGGTPAVNAVAAKARELLLKYYTDCEMTYRRGLAMIINEDQKRPLQPVGGTATAT